MASTGKPAAKKSEANVADGVRVGESPVPGLTLCHVLRGHTAAINRISWSPDGRYLASPSDDNTVRIWDSKNDTFGTFCNGSSNGKFYVVAWSPDGTKLATAGLRNHPAIRSIPHGEMLELRPARKPDIWDVDIWGMSWSPDGSRLVSGHGVWHINTSPPAAPVRILGRGTIKGLEKQDIYDETWSPDGAHIALATNGVHIIDSTTLQVIWKFFEDEKARYLSWSADGHMLAIPFTRSGVVIADVRLKRKLVRLEGHTHSINSVSFSRDGLLLASKSSDNTVRLWRCDTWESVVSVPETSVPFEWTGGLAFNPVAPRLATLGEQNNVVRIWDIDVDLLLKKSGRFKSTKYTSAKVVLAGASGVGKTGLGWRLSHGEFKEHPSTHGQQFWVLDELQATRQDGTLCEAVQWDLAGQADYRLIHALALDDVDLALVLFDPTHTTDPLHGVEFWLKQLRIEAGRGTPAVLVAARTDRGSTTLTEEEIKEFCRKRGLRAYIATSALQGTGIKDLMAQVKGLILWDDKTATVTTDTFKRVKEYVLQLKEQRRDEDIIVTVNQLRQGLEKTDSNWRFSDLELLTAVGHLENHGYVKRLRSSTGEIRILLAPELLNNIAASMVLEARRNPKGLGSLDERQLLGGQYSLRETEDLSESDRRILLDSAVLLFLEHNVCSRETDPLTMQSYLVFPDLINLKKPTMSGEEMIEEGPAYTVSGAVQNLYAALVVLLGYTRQLTRTNQWQNQARYEIGDGLVCGFRADVEQEGERDFVLYFGGNVGAPVRQLFQGLFESFLGRPGLVVIRLDPIFCSNGHLLNRGVVRDYVQTGKKRAFCNECGQQIVLYPAEPLQLTKVQAEKVDRERRVATTRTEFEQVLFQLKTFVQQQGIKSPECFISYAWGAPEHESWVEHSLAADLKKAGVRVLLDRWNNARIGASVSRFVERMTLRTVCWWWVRRLTARNIKTKNQWVAMWLPLRAI